MRTSTQQGPRWNILRIASVILKILASLVLLGNLAVTTLAVIGLTMQASAVDILPGIPSSPLPLAIGSFIGGILSFIFLFTIADLIMLLIAIERNTRNY